MKKYLSYIGKKAAYLHIYVELPICKLVNLCSIEALMHEVRITNQQPIFV